MISFQVDEAAHTRIAIFEGVVDDAELLASYAALVAAPDYDPTLKDLVDMRGVERLEVSADAVHRLAAMFSSMDPADAGTRLAIVAPRDIVFGMARMYEILRSDAPEQIRVFRHRPEAELWLHSPA